MELNPGAPGPHPGPKAGAKPLSYPGIPIWLLYTPKMKHQKEKHSPCREPDVGLDPGTPGSYPGPKAGAKPLSHPGIP